MRKQRYIRNVATLKLEVDKCSGCGMCATVCPHRVFEVADGKAAIVDRDACMECGACSLNCPAEAITVKPGVGCAVAVFRAIFGRGKGGCDCNCCNTNE